MAVQGYYDFINYAHGEGGNSDFVKRLTLQKTEGVRSIQSQKLSLI